MRAHTYTRTYHIAQSGVEDTSNFESRFTTLPPVDSPVETELSLSATQAFMVQAFELLCCACVRACVCVLVLSLHSVSQGFTYVAPSVLEELNKSTLVMSPRRSFLRYEVEISNSISNGSRLTLQSTRMHSGSKQ